MAVHHVLKMDWLYYYYAAPSWPNYLYSIYNAKNSEDTSITVSLPYWWYDAESKIDAQKDCYDPKALFELSTENWYGCAAIATSAFLVQNENITIDESVNEANKRANFGSLKTFNASRVVRQIVGCIEESCTDNNPLGECDPRVAKLTQSQVIADDLNLVLDPLRDLCSVVQKEPEADIAGPGIAVSYYIQVVLTIWFFIVCGLLPHQPDSSTFFGMLRAIRWCVRRLHTRSETERDRLRLTLTRLRSTRFSVALYSTMIEFQETQAFFVMAIEAATLTMIIMNRESLAIRVDVGAAKVFATANTLLVLITQAIMQRRGMYWWYTFILTVIVYVLCAIIQILRLPTSSDSDLSRQHEACGGKQSILQTSIIIFLTIDHLFHLPRLRRMVASANQALTERSIQMPASVLKASSVFPETMHIKKQWTFGQVVAVLVWAPVLSKYIYYNIFGIELGVGNRIDDQYKVVLNEKPPSASPGAQERFDSSTNLVDEIIYIGLRNIGDGQEDQRHSRVEQSSVVEGIRRKPLSARTVP
ncbi:hypothetical protein CORC01_13807 [Colletotrichum orchidophilum]|uniref:Uncharacterized protein n=1 Tax=Colletotrichum orchidophilum TaxID=1209926 RepID=A0A1G4APC6_9PEZI|nr:uncharacterized protein CORC01_13807 [Colletotrichum orchidophilum]OHE90892.1 hypothetical protein CORC01_13807 [Colletotrichum orchidophilum]